MIRVVGVGIGVREAVNLVLVREWATTHPHTHGLRNLPIVALKDIDFG